MNKGQMGGAVWDAVKLFFIVALAAVVAWLSIVMPNRISVYLDGGQFDRVQYEDKDPSAERYQYTISADEKLFVLSNALENRLTPQSDHYALTRGRDYDVGGNAQKYEYVRDGEVEGDGSGADGRSAAFAALRSELGVFASRYALTEALGDFDESDYNCDRYTAINMTDPAKSAVVWELDYIGALIDDGLVHCVMDAQTFKLYEVSFRSPAVWEQYDTDRIVRDWAGALGVSEPVPYTEENPFAEAVGKYRKYKSSGGNGEEVTVTVGFYDGIREFFIRITH